MAKGLKLSQKVLGANFYVCRSYEEKLTGGLFAPILNSVKILFFVWKKRKTQKFRKEGVFAGLFLLKLSFSGLGSRHLKKDSGIRKEVCLKPYQSFFSSFSHSVSYYKSFLDLFFQIFKQKKTIFKFCSYFYDFQRKGACISEFVSRFWTINLTKIKKLRWEARAALF